MGAFERTCLPSGQVHLAPPVGGGGVSFARRLPHIHALQRLGQWFSPSDLDLSSAPLLSRSHVSPVRILRWAGCSFQIFALTCPFSFTARCSLLTQLHLSPYFNGEVSFRQEGRLALAWSRIQRHERLVRPHLCSTVLSPFSRLLIFARVLCLIFLVAYFNLPSAGFVYLARLSLTALLPTLILTLHFPRCDRFRPRLSCKALALICRPSLSERVLPFYSAQNFPRRFIFCPRPSVGSFFFVDMMIPPVWRGLS